MLNENGNAVPCKCREGEIRKRRSNFAEIPEAFKDHTIKNFDTDIYKLDKSKMMINAVLKAVRYYIDDFEKQKENGMGLYLFSRTKGSGKTRMVASIANELLNNYQVKFATSPAIIAEIRGTYDKNSSVCQTESQLLDFLITSEILVIDDFGTEKITDWVNEKLYHIINERYIEKKVTIFTSNNEIGKCGYNPRIISRIQERSYPIRFPEESVREIIALKKQTDFITNAFDEERRNHADRN